MSSYWHSTVTMALSCIISQMKASYWSKIAMFFHTPPAFDAPVKVVPARILAWGSAWKNENGGSTRWWKKFDVVFSRFETTLASDGQTDILRQHSPRYAYASHGKNWVLANIWGCAPNPNPNVEPLHSLSDAQANCKCNYGYHFISGLHNKTM